MEEQRGAAGHIISMCFLVALNDKYGIGEERLRKVTEAAGGILDRFDVMKRGVGFYRAKRKLAEDTAGFFPDGFLLPATKTPKKWADWAALGEQREAADIVIRCYALAAKRVLGFGPERIQKTVDAATECFRRFGEYAKDGDVYGYTAMAEELGRIFHTQMTVDESAATVPIFGNTLD